MKPILLALVLLISTPAAQASWTRQFRQSDQQFRVYVNQRDQTVVTAGFFLTSFPCYSMNAQDYYITIAGRNTLTLFCLFPPEEIMISFTTRRRGTHIARNEPMDGYLRCPVVLRDRVRTGVIPRLEVFVEDCTRRDLNRDANRELVNRFNTTDRGMTISEFFGGPAEPPSPPAPAPAPRTGGGHIGSIPFIEVGP